MYDPEYSLELERKLVLDQTLLTKVEKRCGENHPWTQRIKLVVDILKIITKKEQDLMNCWDKSQQELICFKINELIFLAKDALK